jgi:hypothetical protein
VAAVDAPGRLGPSERVYSALVRLYPVAFRARYHEEMVRLFSDQLRDARGGRGDGGVGRLWLRSLGDLISTVAREHLRKDGTVAQSLATFEPTRSMRLLGMLGIVGAVLLLLAFITSVPFEDQALSTVRLLTFDLAGAAIALAFYRRQSPASPRLVLLTTAAVVIGGVWSASGLLLAPGVDRPAIGTFGLLQLFANITLWVSPAAWAIAALHTGALWRGMTRSQGFAAKAGLWTLIGSAVAWFGDDRLGMVDSLWGEMWQTVALAGVAMNGIGWLVLGGVLVVGDRARHGAATG